MCFFFAHFADLSPKLNSQVVLSDLCEDRCADSHLCFTEPDKFFCRSLGFVLNTLAAGNFPSTKRVLIENSYTSNTTETVMFFQATSFSVSCAGFCTLRVNIVLQGKVFFVEFYGIFVTDSIFSIQNVQLTLKNAFLANVSMLDVNPMPETQSQIRVFLFNTSFACLALSNPSSIFIFEQTYYIFLTAEQTSFCETMLYVSATSLLVISRNVTFTRGFMVLKSSQNILVYFETVNILQQNTPVVRAEAMTAKIYVTNSSIHDSEGGITLLQTDSGLLDSWIEINLEESSFHNNTKQQSGAAVEVKFVGLRQQNNSHVKVYLCSFSDNKVTQTSQEFVTGGALEFYAEVTSQGTISKLEIMIQNSTFLNNYAEKGGAIYFSGTAIHMTLHTCLFQYTTETHSIGKGLFVAGYSNIVIVQYKIQIFFPVNTESLFDLQMTHVYSEVEHLDFEVLCLPWHNLNVKNVLRPNTNGHHILGEVAVSCVPCTPMFYAFSKNSFHGLYTVGQSHILTKTLSPCLPCPTGGHCPGNNLLSKPNYGGINSRGKIVFHQCPAQYCCQGSITSPCTKYNGCSTEREGILCSKCKPGFSLSVLSSTCIKEDECNNFWFWVVSCFAALLYTIWYSAKQYLLQYSISIHFLISRLFGKAWEKPDPYPVENEGYFGILVYFVQASVIFRMSFSSTQETKLMRFWTQIETYLSLSFTFKVSYIQKDLCLLKNMKFSEKQFLKFIFLLAIFVWWFVCLLLLLCTIKSKLWHNKTMWFEMLMTGLVKYTYEIHLWRVF